MKRLALALVTVVVAGALVATAVAFASDEPTGTTIEHDGDRVTLAAGPAQEVIGRTDLEPGATFQLQLTGTEDAHPFLLRDQTTVDDDRSFTATFDMRGVSEGTTANLTVSHNGSELASATVEVVACDGDCEPREQQSSGTMVDHDGDALTLTGTAGQEVTGDSDREPGTELQVALRSMDATNPLLMREETTVADDGSFAVTMDLSAVSESTNASVSVRHDGEELSRTNVTIEPCEDCEDRTAASDGESDASTEFGLEDDVVFAEGDETAEIPVALGDADAATLRVGGDDVNYQVTATARDEDDDGRVVFVLDPSAAHTATQTVTVADAGDSVSIGSESEVDGPLSPADYDLSLYNGPSTDGDVDEVGTLSLQSS